MKIRPIRTLPLRLRLKAEGRMNALTALAAPVLKRDEHAVADDLPVGYLKLEIHPYALVGHQVASWVHGYLWARDLQLEYLGGDLSRDAQGLFNFAAVTTEPPSQNVKTVRLPWVSDERDSRSIGILRARVTKARRRYPNRTLIFRLALDPARWNQVDAEDVVRTALEKGYKGEEFLQKEANAEYVAIHVRRGSDIHKNHISGKEAVNRWVLEEWHVEIVKAIRSVPALSELEVRVYALGQPEDFPLLTEAGVSLRLNGDRDTDLIELAAAKVLVLSPSSFSFTAALVSRGLVLGRVPWWHHIPNDGRWVQIDADGKFDAARVQLLAKTGH